MAVTMVTLSYSVTNVNLVDSFNILVIVTITIGNRVTIATDSLGVDTHILTSAQK